MKKSKQHVKKGMLGAGLGAVGGGLVGGPLGAADGAALGSGIGKKSDAEPMQKVLGTLAAGALGGKLLGLSKKEDVSLQKVLPLAALAVPAAASLASGMMGGGKKSDDKEDDEAIQKVVGKLISGVGQKVQGLGLQEDDEEKEELQKHRGKSFHSHKRKSPFSSRRRR